MKPTTSLCHATADDVIISGRSLPDAIIGKVSFTQLFYRHLTGRDPCAAQIVALDACLVTLMEHGLTPSAISARLTLTGAPESLQGAVAAGLLGVGDVFAGASEAAGAALQRIADAPDPAAAAAREVEACRAHQQRVPGFGHPLHKPVDPRAESLRRVAVAHDLVGRHAHALDALAAAVADGAGRSIPINATGAIAALLLDAGVPLRILRGVAVVSRAAGLVGHLAEEQQRPAGVALWQAAEGAIPYVPHEEPTEQEAP